MNVLSLFDGISCGMVALDRAGIPVKRYVAYEIEQTAIAASKDNWPDIEHKGNVFDAVYTPGEFDLLIGGSPCTYWSICAAGKGTRETVASGLGWDLFSQYIRALHEAQPKYFLYENNASMSADIRNCITAAFGCEPYEIDSANFSAQNRHRLYWTNIPIGELPKCDLVLKDIMQQEVPEKYYLPFDLQDLDMSKDICARIGNWNYDMMRRVYNPASKSPTLTCVTGGKQEKKVLDNGRPRKLTPIEYERLQTLPDDYTKAIKSNGKRYTAIGNGWTVDVIAWILKGLKEASND